MPNFTAISEASQAPFISKGNAKHSMVPLITFNDDSGLPTEEIPCLRWVHIDLYAQRHRTEINWSLATHGRTRDAFAGCDFSFCLEAEGRNILSTNEINPIPRLRIRREGMSWYHGEFTFRDTENEIFYKIKELTIPSLSLEVPINEIKLRRWGRGPAKNIAEAEEALRDAEASLYPENPGRIARRMEDLATFLEEAERSSEAEAMYLRAVEIWERISPGNELAFGTLEKLGGLLKKGGRFREPEQLYSRVVAASDAYQLRKRVYLEPRNYPAFSYDASMFKFQTDELLLELMIDIAKMMVSLFDIPPEEAIGRINSHWKGRTFDLGDHEDIVFHETPDYWAKRIYYKESWWTNLRPPLNPKPYP